MKPCNVLLLTLVCVCIGYGQDPALLGTDQEVKCGEGQLGPLMAATRNKDAVVRRAATDTLGQLSNEAMHAVLDYTKLLNDEILPRLEELLKDKDSDVRRAAADALGRTGGLAKAAVPSLTKLLKDENDGVRRCAADALGRIGPDARSAIAGLTDLLRDERELIRQAATESLREIKVDKK